MTLNVVTVITVIKEKEIQIHKLSDCLILYMETESNNHNQ